MSVRLPEAKVLGPSIAGHSIVRAGYDRRQLSDCFVRIGLISLSTDMVSEHEIRKMMHSDDIAISSTRIPTANPVTRENLLKHEKYLAEAASLFDAALGVNCFVYACTSGTSAIGRDRIAEAVQSARPGAGVTSPLIGAVAAFKALGLRSVSMLTPYPEEIMLEMRDHIRSAGFGVSRMCTFDIHNDMEITQVSPTSILSAALSMDTAGSDGFFIPCTGLLTVDIIDELEEELRMPVVTAHQAMYWHALRLSGRNDTLDRFGTLMGR